MEDIDNMEIYNRYAEVPKEAKKTIRGGRLSGYTDIDPMWRIKCLTEMFGPCGMDWKTELLFPPTYRGPEDEQVVVIYINLSYKWDGEWQAPILGIGAAKASTQEKNGLYVDDEAEKKAYSDAISVACKALGIGANVYWGAGATKYSEPEAPKPEATQHLTAHEIADLEAEVNRLCWTMDGMLQTIKVDSVQSMTKSDYAKIMRMMKSKPDGAAGRPAGAA